MIMRQAIITRYLGPTDRRGARVKATAQAGSVTLPWDYALDPSENAKAAAKVLAEKNDWHGTYFGGCLPDGSYVFVDADGDTPIVVVREER